MPLFVDATAVRRWRPAGLLILLVFTLGCPVRDLPPEVVPAEPAITSSAAPAPSAADDAAAPDEVLPEDAAALVTAAAPSNSPSNSPAEPPEVHVWVQQVLQANLDNRVLSTDVNAAWQIMHGVLAYGRDLTIHTPTGRQPAVTYLLGGGAARGFELTGGQWFDIPADQNAADQNAADQKAAGGRRRGLVAVLDPGAKIGQGHRDQWLAYMARCGLRDDDEVVTRDGPLSIAGWIEQIQWDVPLNFEQEFSWTLTALVTHRPTTARWVARDGRHYSIESLLESELRQLSPSSACGGSHRLFAIANSLNRHRQAGHPITGVWAEADHLVQAAIAQTRAFQNADGSFSSHYFERPGWSLDLSAALGTTGHVFEFLAIALGDHELQSPWMQRAARFLCRTLEQTAELDLECGALYHALSGLSIYHERITSADTAAKL